MRKFSGEDIYMYYIAMASKQNVDATATSTATQMNTKISQRIGNYTFTYLHRKK